MIKYLRLLASILLVTSLQAAQVAVQRSQHQLNQELFEFFTRDDATVEQLEELLDQGADPNARNEYDITPLIWAILGGALPVDRMHHIRNLNIHQNTQEYCATLLQRGASIEAQVECTWIPNLALNRFDALYCAIHYLNHEALAALIDNSQPLIRDISDLPDNYPHIDVFARCMIAPRQQLHYNSFITALEHSIALPPLESLPEARKCVVSAICALKEMNLPKEIIDLILPYIGDHFFTVLFARIAKGKSIPGHWHDTLLLKIHHATYESLLSNIGEPLLGELNDDHPANKVYDREEFEELHGTHLDENIRKRLSNPPVIHPVPERNMEYYRKHYTGITKRFLWRNQGFLLQLALSVGLAKFYKRTNKETFAIALFEQLHYFSKVKNREGLFIGIGCGAVLVYLLVFAELQTNSPVHKLRSRFKAFFKKEEAPESPEEDLPKESEPYHQFLDRNSLTSAE